MSDLFENPKTRFLALRVIVLQEFHTCKCMGPCPLGSKEIDGLLVPPGKASLLLTDHLITG